MPDKYLYLFVDTLCVIFPFIFSFHKRIRFYTQWRYFILPCFVTSVVFITWDIIFTAKGIWNFNPRYVLGLYFAGLPVEELLFFFCIPYACVFTYYAISISFKIQPTDRTVRFITILLATLLAAVGVYFITRLYTSVAFLFLASILIILTARRDTFLGTFYIAFLITLIPFYLSNGVLTGLLTPEPVVKYNNEYNLGIRTLTIPVEDIFYGMALLLMNVAGFELRKSSQK
jgi:lycopene cyclase domain-containing protein